MKLLAPAVALALTNATIASPLVAHATARGKTVSSPLIPISTARSSLAVYIPTLLKFGLVLRIYLLTLPKLSGPSTSLPLAFL
jgi:hypothetical protein